jgi:hypothetical protein
LHELNKQLLELMGEQEQATACQDYVCSLEEVEEVV